MPAFNIGDIVIRKSYGGDIAFQVIEVNNKRGVKPHYVLKGITHRIFADSDGDDLVKQDTKQAYDNVHNYLSGVRKHASINKVRRPVRMPFYSGRTARPGTILHIDSSEDFMNKCLQNYDDANIKSVGRVASEEEQPEVVVRLLEKYRPDIVVLTGHDSMKKDSDYNSIGSYRNSRYFIEAVKAARRFEPSFDGLCIFAGACQSYFEGIMSAGANFASSPQRVLINALDPAIVSEKIALTDYRMSLTPQQVAAVTITGSKGIGGRTTRGRLKWV